MSSIYSHENSVIPDILKSKCFPSQIWSVGKPIDEILLVMKLEEDLYQKILVNLRLVRNTPYPKENPFVSTSERNIQKALDKLKALYIDKKILPDDENIDSVMKTLVFTLKEKLKHRPITYTKGF